MGFLNSPPMLYETMKHDGVLKQWAEQDWPTILQPLAKMGWNWNPNNERLELPLQKFGGSMQFNTPWCHAMGTHSKHCGMDHQILFNVWRIIHPRCLHCWKVVVTPATFKQLLQLERLQLDSGVPCKCGIELRDYTPKFYGGYFYNNSLDEGRERYEQVRKAVDEQLDDGKNVSVILKRGCTEYEFVKGPSVYWHNTPEEEAMIEAIEAYVDVPRSNTRQSEMIKNNVRLRWAIWAHMNGDMSYKEFNGGRSLFPDYLHYEEGDIEDLKHDLAVGNAQARAGVDPEVTNEFLAVAQQLADKHEVPMNEMTTLLGAEVSNPLMWKHFNVRKNTPEPMKGEQDQSTSVINAEEEPKEKE